MALVPQSISAECRSWVRNGKAQNEHKFSGLPPIVLQKSFCTGDQKFCGLQARLSCKDVRDLIASR
jgi:hypothetical protein